MRKKTTQQPEFRPRKWIDQSMLNRSLPDLSRRRKVGFDNATLEELEQQAKPKRSYKKILKKTAIILCCIALIAGLWVGWKVVSNSAKIFGWGNLFGLFHKTKLKGEDEGRVTLLLAGNSSDDPGHGGAELTDSIMIASINTEKHTAFLLSIPRDLYVDVPGFGYSKINEVYQDGESENFKEAGYANGGMGLLEKVVSQKFGITPNYYALVNYSALRDAVNAVGGITVNVQSSNPNGLYDPSIDLTTRKPLVDLRNGVQTLNGDQALGLARARGNSPYAYGFPLSDFSRAEHQRWVLVALKDKAGSTATLSNPIKVGQLFDSLGNNVKTDMKLAEVRRLYELGKKVPNSAITSAALNNGEDRALLGSYQTKYGQSALVPKAGVDDYSQIQAYVKELIGQ